MRDRDVRLAVRLMLAAKYSSDDDTRIVEEMGVWSGSVRIDIAVINGELTGIELKSERDTLERLPSQCALYSRVFDRMVLVVAERHTDRALPIIPLWWGVTTAALREGVTLLSASRESALNPSPDPFLVAQLLWKCEAMEILDILGMAKGWRSKPVAAIHERLATTLGRDELSNFVRSALKRRSNWLGQPISNDRQMPVDTDFHPTSPAA